MELTISMQFVMMRAKAEFAASKGSAMGAEHVFLGILKLAEVKPQDVTSRSRYQDEVKDDIARVRELFSERNMITTRVRAQLRSALGSYRAPMGRDPQSELESVMRTAERVAAAKGDDALSAAVMLGVLMSDPVGPIGEVVPKAAKADMGGAQPRVERRQSREDETPAAPPAPHSDAEEMSQAFLPALTERIRTMRSRLLNTVRGQDHAVHAFCEGMFAAEVLAASDEKRRRPRAIFVFAGPPGVGKTFLAEQGAEALGLPCKRFDMSSFSDHQAYMNLIGFERSYQGAKPGTLTGFVKESPHSILIFDEIEKAHLNTIQLFLQILDAGRLNDKYLDEDVQFRDTIIIFTTNAGRSLYEDETRANAAGVPRKTILNALETETDQRTGEPFFPAAITSRMATGWPLMFNHLQANDLETISSSEFDRLAGLFKTQYGIEVRADELLATTLLFGEGGQADARTLRAQTELFFKNETFKLCRLFNADSFAGVLSSLECIRFEVETGSMPANVRKLFSGEETPEVLVYCPDGLGRMLADRLPGFVFHQTSNAEEALRIAGERDVRVMLLDLDTEHGAEDTSEREGGSFDYASMAASAFREETALFRAVRERLPELPVYLLETDRVPIDSELEMSFARAGARGKLNVRSSEWSVLQDELEDVCRRLYMQGVAAKLASERQVLYYETAPHFSPDHRQVVIRLRDLRLKRALAADDTGDVLDDAERPNVRFADVIGAGEAKDELQFFINFLREPKKFSAQGMKPPKGVLLYGPPGTGKTLLARAMAGESGVAFIPATASSFVTKWQGSGPEAVRSLFKKARRYAPSIIFIDEIDAIGRTRAGDSTAHGEEMALNALLTEMDGFSVDPKRPIFVLAATNFGVEEGDRSSMGTIDPALARRFDRRILVDLPTKDDRRAYLDMMLGKNRLSTVTPAMTERLAGRSTGMSLANLASVMELANRMSLKQDRPLDDSLLEEAFEQSRFGAEKNWGHEYLERVARHESGHAFLCWKAGNTPAYLTIVARGDHGGYMEHSDEDMGPLQTRDQLIGRIRTSLGGRASEIVYYGPKDGISTGAAGDLEQATRLARAMICSYGMDEEFGMAVMSAEEATRGPLAERVSQRVSRMIREQMDATIETIRENRPCIDRLVEALLARNKLTREEMEAILSSQA